MFNFHLWYNPCLMFRCQTSHIHVIPPHVFSSVMWAITIICHNVMCMPLVLHEVTRMFKVMEPRYHLKDVSALHAPISESILSSGHTSWLHCHLITISHSHQATRSGKHHPPVNDISGRCSVSGQFTFWRPMYGVHVSTSAPKPTVLVLSYSNVGLMASVAVTVLLPFSILYTHVWGPSIKLMYIHFIHQVFPLSDVRS